MVATVVHTVNPGGGGLPNYTTLAAWELDQRRNLVTADEVEVAEIYGGGSVGIVQLLSANWTVNSTHYVHIRAATGEGHGGVFNASKAYILPGFNNIGIETRVGWTRIGPGISMQSGGGGVGAIMIMNISGNAPCIIDGVIARSTGTATTYGFAVTNGGGGTHIVKNCVINQGGAGAGETFHRGVYSQDSNSFVSVENCTIHTSDTGAASGCLVTYLSGTITSQNNYLDCPGGVCYQKYTGSGTINKGTNDATSNTEAVTAALRSIAYSTANFTSVTGGSEDVHLTVTSALLLKGAELSDVTTDFEGDSRVGLIYDIGADQQSDIPMCWNYTARYKNSNRLFKASGCGSFPRSLQVPSNVDTSTGKMIDDGVEIDPREYRII